MNHNVQLFGQLSLHCNYLICLCIITRKKQSLHSASQNYSSLSVTKYLVTHRVEQTFLLACLVSESVKEERSCIPWYELPYT